jgi:hypothetical protein
VEQTVQRKYRLERPLEQSREVHAFADDSTEALGATRVDHRRRQIDTGNVESGVRKEAGIHARTGAEFEERASVLRAQSLEESLARGQFPVLRCAPSRVLTFVS